MTMCVLKSLRNVHTSRTMSFHQMSESVSGVSWYTRDCNGYIRTNGSNEYEMCHLEVRSMRRKEYTP